MSKSTFSRRAIVAGAAALATGATANVVAIAATKSISSPTVVTEDAELLALGEQLKPLFVEWYKIRATTHRLRSQVERAVETWAITNKSTCEQFSAHNNKFREASERTGYSRATGCANDLHERIWELADAILEIDAATQAGITVRMAAALTKDDSFDFLDHSGNRLELLVLWECVARAGFPVPSYVKGRFAAIAKRRNRFASAMAVQS